MILKDCKIGDIVWVWDYVFNKYAQVQILGPVKDINYIIPQVRCQPINDPDLTLPMFSVTHRCWKECPKEKPKLKYYSEGRTLYDRIYYPEYKEYKDKPGFDDNSVYDEEHNSYFIKVNWVKAL